MCGIDAENDAFFKDSHKHITSLCVVHKSCEFVY